MSMITNNSSESDVKLVSPVVMKFEEYINLIKERVERDVKEYENRNELYDNYNCGLIGVGGEYGPYPVYGSSAPMYKEHNKRCKELYEEYIKNKQKYDRLYKNCIISNEEYHKKTNEIYKEYIEFYESINY